MQKLVNSQPFSPCAKYLVEEISLDDFLAVLHAHCERQKAPRYLTQLKNRFASGQP